MGKPQEDRNIYKKLRDLRIARGLTMDTLASRIGEDTQKVGRIERGKRSLTVDYLLKVAKVLETPAETLLQDSNKEEKHYQRTLKSDILNDIIMLVEQCLLNLVVVQKNHLRDSDILSEKAGLISKLYSLTSNLTEDQQHLFMGLLTEVCNYIKDRSNPHQ